MLFNGNLNTIFQPDLRPSVEVPFANKIRPYWAEPTDRQELQQPTYGAQALSVFGALSLGTGLYYGLPRLMGKTGRAADYWFDQARKLEANIPIFNTFRLSEALSTSIAHGPTTINLRGLSADKRFATSTFLKHIMGISPNISRFSHMQFIPDAKLPYTGILKGITWSGTEETLHKSVKLIKPGRLFESYLSWMQPGLFGDVEASRRVFGGADNTKFIPIPSQGRARDVLAGVRSYFAFSMQRLSDLLSSVGSEIGIPGTKINLNEGIKRIGLKLTPGRASGSRMLFGYAKLGSMVGLGLTAISTLDAYRSSGNLVEGIAASAGVSGIAYVLGRRIAGAMGRSPVKGGRIGLAASALQFLPGFKFGVIPGLAGVIPALNMARSRIGEVTGLNTLRRWTESTFPGSTGIGTATFMGILGGTAAYNYMRYFTRGELGPSLRKDVLPIVQELQYKAAEQALPSKLAKNAGRVSDKHRRMVQETIESLLNDNVKLFSSTKGYEALEVARRIRQQIQNKLTDIVPTGGFLNRTLQALKAGAKAGRWRSIIRPAAMIGALWGVTSLGTAETPEALQRIYRGEQLVPVRRGRNWEFGRSPYKGKDILYWRQHWLPRMIARAKVASMSEMDPLEQLFNANFTYKVERSNYDTRPYTITGAAFDQIPFISTILRPLGDLIKPPRLMHVSEWARVNEDERIELKYVDDALSPQPSSALGGLPPGAPVSPYSTEQGMRRMFYELTELAGLVGYATQFAYGGITGADLPFDEDTVLQPASDIYSLRRAFWDQQMGGALFGIPFMSESVRRFIPAIPAGRDFYSPIRNALPNWLPEDLRYGDPYTNVRYGLGEERLPGPMYDALYNTEGDYGLPHRLRILADTASWSPEFRETRDKALQYMRLFGPGAKYKFLYKTTNTITGEVYYGVHTTNTLDDDYVGSGVEVKAALRKYGPSALRREILEFFPTTQELYEAEADLVDWDLLDEQGVMNRQPGGSGFENIDNRTAIDMRNTILNLQKKRNKLPVDYYSTSPSGYGYYDAEGNLRDINEGIRAKGAIAGSAGRVWEGFIHGIGGVLAPVEHLMPAGLAPWAKLVNESDPVEDYEANKVYGQEYKFWSNPWQNWFRPAITSAQRYWLGDETIPEHVQEMRGTNEYYDKVRWLKYQRLAVAARTAGDAGLAGQYMRVARSTTFGANPFGGESTVKYAIPYSERSYFDSFSMATQDDTQRDIMSRIPHDQRAVYQGVWQSRLLRALQRKSLSGQLDAAGQEQMNALMLMRQTEGRTFNQGLFAQYRQVAPTGMSYADWHRLKEAETFFAQHPLPNPDWVGWNPAVDVEDMKMMQINEEGKDYHEYSMFQSRLRMIPRKPYLNANQNSDDFWYGQRLSNYMDSNQYNRLVRNLMIDNGQSDFGFNYGFNSSNRATPSINIDMLVPGEISLQALFS